MSNRHKFIVGLTILILSLVFGAWQYSIMRANLFNIKAYAVQNENIALEKSALIKEYQEIKSEISGKRIIASHETLSVFPIKEDITNLTRLFDEFAIKNNFNSNPFFISKITYKTSEESEGHMYVPVTVQMTSSKRNLLKFLEYIHSSGSVESGVRLMSIEDFTVNYPNEINGTYSVSMEIKAYFDSI